jgi:outer membrane lipoprotein carrier protein
MKRLFVLFLSLPIVLLAHQSPPEMIQRLEVRLQSYVTLQASFEQIYSPVTVSQPTRERGWLYYKKPNLMRWEYTGEEKRVYLIKNNLLWEYLPGENQLIIYDLSSKDFNQTLLSLLSGKITIENEYEISLLSSSNPKTYKLQLIPLQETSEYEQIELELDKEKWFIRRLGFTDWAGNQTEFKFKDIKINLSLGPDLFQLDIPDGTEVIDYRKK